MIQVLNTLNKIKFNFTDAIQLLDLTGIIRISVSYRKLDSARIIRTLEQQRTKYYKS